MALLLAWQAFVDLRLLNPSFFASPLQIATAFPFVFDSFLSEFYVTLETYLTAFVLVSTLGFTSGVLLGLRDSVFRSANPYLGWGLLFPKAVLIPLFLLFFSLRTADLMFAFLLGVFPVILNVASGIRDSTTEATELARSYGYSTLEIYRKVIMPAVLPSLFTGLFMGSNLTMIGVLVMEMHHSFDGLGALMTRMASYLQTPQLYAVAVLTLAFTTLMNGFLWYLSQRFNKWRLA